MKYSHFLEMTTLASILIGLLFASLSNLLARATHLVTPHTWDLSASHSVPFWVVFGGAFCGAFFVLWLKAYIKKQEETSQ